MSFVSHIKSAVSLLFITTNLMCWLPPLLMLALLKLVIPFWHPPLNQAMAWIYRAAVVIDDWWLCSVIGLDWNQPCDDLVPEGRYIILCNHRSWADIFLAQSVITRSGPIINFLIKRELILIPIIGLILWAYEFPVLRRRSAPGEDDTVRRQKDRAALLEACNAVRTSPAALLIFAEGTRFTASKREQAATRFRHVLPPRPSGFATSFAALRNDLTGVIDLTLIYPQPISFWTFLSGHVDPIRIEATVYSSEQLPDDEEQLRDWLRERWSEKDERLAFRR